MRFAFRSTLAAALVALTATACATPRTPQVQVEGVRVGGIGLRGGTLIARVLITNPNAFDLETGALSYNLQIAPTSADPAWVDFAQGTIEERVRVERRSSRILEVPIQFRYEDVGGALRSIMDTGTFAYRVTGDVRLREPIGRTFPYQRTGTVSLDGVRE